MATVAATAHLTGAAFTHDVGEGGEGAEGSTGHRRIALCGIPPVHDLTRGISPADTGAARPTHGFAGLLYGPVLSVQDTTVHWRSL